MARMNYGKRFRGSAVGVGWRYDAFMHRSLLPPFQVRNASPEAKAYGQAIQHSVVAKRKGKVGMPKFSFSEKPKANDRAEAEQRMIERLNQAVELIEFSLVELAAIPNPTHNFKNRVNQKMIIETLQTLCMSVSPPLRLAQFENAAAAHHQQVKMKLEDVPTCVTCSGPARMQYRGKWYCPDCVPNDPLARAAARAR